MSWSVGGLAAQAAVLVTALGVAVTVLVWVRTRAWTPTIPVFLELMLAAGLLRLGADGSWRAIATSAAIVSIRTTVRSTARTRVPAPGRSASTDRGT